MTNALIERLGVAEDKQAQPPVNDPYEAIREICEEQAFFDEIGFAPLGGDEGVLAVTGA